VENKSEVIKKIKAGLESSDTAVLLDCLSLALSVIESLSEENSSVWGLIDEMKASEVQAHSDVLKKELDRKIAETFSLVNSKVVLA
jgi:hypothetical protein